MSKKLNQRQLAFIQEYLVCGNATKSAIKAGYSKKTAYSQGQRMLKNVEVKKAIAKAQQKTAERNEITLDEVVGNARELVKRGLEPDPVMQFDHEKKEMVETGEYKYDSSAVAKGNEQLIRMGGFYAPEKHEHKHDFSDMTEEELRGKLLSMRAKQ